MACLSAAGATAATDASEPVSGIARVQEDGSLAIGDSLVRLAGVYIPPRRDCRSAGVDGCAPRAVAALENRVSSGFVRCAVTRRRGGSLEGFCSADGRGVLDPRTDLGAWLVERGLALAGSGAPHEYLALERLAKAQGRGLWARSRAVARRPYR